MIDKPVPAKIILRLADIKSTGEAFIGLSGSLYRQNLIFPEPRELRMHDGILELIITFRDIKSFKNWNRNIEIEEFWTPKFTSLLAEKPNTIAEKDLILEIDNIINCSCQKSDFYILQGRTLKLTDELVCNKCLGQVPYSSIPLNIKIEDWQLKYSRVYLNWIESGLFEKEAYKELTNYSKGKLNIEGEKIREQLSNYFNLPVFISYFIDFDNDKCFCPICGGRGSKTGLKTPARMCKSCNTTFGYND